MRIVFPRRANFIKIPDEIASNAIDNGAPLIITCLLLRPAHNMSLFLGEEDAFRKQKAASQPTLTTDRDEPAAHRRGDIRKARREPQHRKGSTAACSRYRSFAKGRRAMAEHAASRLKSLRDDEVVGELSRPRAEQLGAFDASDKSRHGLHAGRRWWATTTSTRRAASLAIATIDAEMVVSAAARLKYCQPAYIGEKNRRAFEGRHAQRQQIRGERSFKNRRA